MAISDEGVSFQDKPTVSLEEWIQVIQGKRLKLYKLFRDEDHCLYLNFLESAQMDPTATEEEMDQTAPEEEMDQTAIEDE